MARLHIALLGGLEIAGGEATAKPSLTRKAKALVAYLALQGARGQSREKLAELFWGNSAEEQARANLRQALSSVRKVLNGDESAYLATAGEQIALAGQDIDLDVAEFERLAAEATADALERAALIYRGDLLDGFSLKEDSFEAWIRVERERLRHLACDVLSKLIAHSDEVGDTESCIETAARLLRFDPLCESAHRTLMHAYTKTGRQALALKQFEACRDILKRELDVEPEPETAALYREIRRQRKATSEERIDTLLRDAVEAPPLPEKPSIAVLPFANLSGDPEQDYFADGLTEDVINHLARFRSLFVIHSTSSLPYRGETPRVQEVGRTLGVAYVARGSVRKAGDRVRIAVALIEAASGRQLWAERYDRNLEDIFAVQDEVAGKVVATLAGQIEDTDRRRAAAKLGRDLAAYELVLLGEQAEKEFTQDGVLRARALFLQALEREPDNARAHASMARTYLDELWSDWSADWDAAAAQALDWAQKAVALDELDNRARTNLGVAYQYGKGNFEAAQAQFAKALELNPNDADAYCLRGWCHVYAGEGEEAIACTDLAIRLSPFDLDGCLYAQSAAHYLARRYAEALESLGRMVDPAYPIDAFRAACYAQLGRDNDARQAMETFMSEGPEKFIDWPGEDPEAWRRLWIQRHPFLDPSNLEHLLDGFRKAGMPV